MRALRVIAGFSGFLSLYFLTAFWLKAHDPALGAPEVRGEMVRLRRPFSPYGLRVTVPDYWFGSIADSATNPCRSTIMIYENDQPLGPMHSTDFNQAGGRALHWRQGDNPALFRARSIFVFSSSDGTDPRKNGRNYWAVRPMVDAITCPDTQDKYAPPPFFALEGPPRTVIHLKSFEISRTTNIVQARDAMEDLEDIADDPDGDRSPALLYEDDQLLGPPHALHAEIAALGAGRYSHWKGQGMVFSTSDNSDPNKNGRNYYLVVP